MTKETVMATRKKLQVNRIEQVNGSETDFVVSLSRPLSPLEFAGLTQLITKVVDGPVQIKTGRDS
jgi:hypothetical protein